MQPTPEQTNIDWLKDSFRDLASEMRTGFKDVRKEIKAVDDKMDLYSKTFETKEDARREYDRIHKKVDGLAGKMWGVASAVILAVIGGIISFFFNAK